MELETQRLNLKTISLVDIEDIHKLHSYPEVDEYNTTGIPKDLEATKKSVEPFIRAQSNSPRKYYTFKISLKNSNEFIGIAGITLSLDKFKAGEIYYEIAPPHWNMGYATEAVKRLIKAGFEDLMLHKIEANTITENIGSKRVLEKSGMIKEGLRRKVIPVRGLWKDGFLYAIVEDDPRE